MSIEPTGPSAQRQGDEQQSADSVLSQFTDGFIRWKAKQLVGKAGFTRSDEDDIVQEFRLRLLERLSKFDPTRAHFHVFVVTVIERYAASLLKHARAEKRDRRRARSMDAAVGADDDSCTFGDWIVRDGRRDSVGRSDFERVDRVLDIAEALAALPSELQRLCELLKACRIGDLARETTTPRSTLTDKVRKVRTHLEDAGLRIYLSD